MRKHFLILMLFALLPLASWAADISNVKFVAQLPTVYTTTVVQLGASSFTKESNDILVQEGELSWTLQHLNNYDGQTQPTDWTEAQPINAIGLAGWYKLTVVGNEANVTSWASDPRMIENGVYVFFVARQPLDVTVTYTAPTVYTGVDQTPALTVMSGEDVVSSANYEWTWKYVNTHEAPASWTSASVVTTVQNAGYYQLTVTDAAVGNYDLNFTNGSDVTAFDVAKADNEFTTLSLDNWAWGATPNTPTATPKFGDANDVVFKYSTDESSWTTTVPSEVGPYFVKASLAGTDNYGALEQTIQFSIAKANIVSGDFTAPAAITSLVYNGQAQDLHDAGTMTSYTDCKFKYATSATAAAADWSDEPIKGTNAGGYSVYFKIVGDAHHRDYPATLIADTEIQQAPLTISAASRTVGYTGTPLDNSEFYTITSGALIGADAQNATLKNSLVSVGWVGSETQPVAANADGWMFALTAGNPLNYDVTIGSGNGSLVITKQNLKAIVSQIDGYTYGEKVYNVGQFNTTYKTMDDQPIAVTPKSISYAVVRTKLIDETTGDNQDYFTRDGDAITGVKGDVGTYTVTPTVEFDNYAVTLANTTVKTFKVSQATLNSSWITLSATEFEYDGQSNPHMPTVTVAKGETALVAGTDYQVMAPADKINVGEKTITISAIGNYKNPTAGANTKKYEITPAPLTIVVKNKNKAWDGNQIADYTTNAATLNNFATIYNDLGEEYDEVFKVVGTPASTNYPEFEVVKKNVGTIDNPVMDNSYAGEYVFKAKGFTARNYDVMVANGTFTIGAPSIRIKAKNTTKNYGDDDPVFDYEVYIGASTTPVSLEQRQNYVKTGPTSITRSDLTKQTVGEYTITCSEDAVLNDNYASTQPTYATGTFTIEKAQLRILADAKDKVYDGQEPAASSLTYTPIGLKYNDAISSVKLVKAAGTDVGKYDITASEAVVTNADQYDIKYQKAKYEITRRALTKIDVLDQAITIKADNSAESRAAAIETLDKAKVTFTAAGGYELSSADYQKLQSEFNFAFADAVDVSVSTFDDVEGKNTPVEDAIKIAFVDAEKKFTNFSLPTVSNAANAAEISLNAAVNDKYALGNLSIFTTYAGDMVFDDSETDEDKTVTKLITTYVGQNIPSVKVKLNRNQVLGTTNCNWAAEKWNTMVLPFDVTIREISAQLGYAIVNVVDKENTTANNVAFKLQMVGTIKANTPFVVKTDVAVPNETVLSFTNKTIVDASASVDAGCGYEFVGVYETKKLGGGTAIDDSKLSFLRGNGDKWAHIGAGSANSWNIVPMAAYIDLTPAVDAREVTFTMQEADGSTTVIRNITGEAAAKLNAEGWYTINGIKLDNAPVEKGVYIHNGKKVVLK